MIIPNFDTDDTDENSQKLFAEFIAHYDEYCEVNPGADQRLVFEAWVIQKISSIQLAVLDLYSRTGESDVESFGDN